MLKAAIFIGLSLRISVAIWNGFFGPSFGADLDALSFHFAAVDYAHNLVFDEFVIGWIYSYVLGLFYFLTIDSLFLGSLLSCVAWFISAIFLLKCFRMLSVGYSLQVKAMLIYAFLPSSVLLTSVTLREPYQLLFVNLAIFAALKIYLFRVIGHWFTLWFAVVGAGILHGALLAWGILFIAATLLMCSAPRRKNFSLIKFGMAVFVAVAVLTYGFSFFSNLSYSLEDGLENVVRAYQQNLINVEARANYRSDIAVSGVGDLFIFIPVALIQYLFEPFPWHVSAFSDVVMTFENLLRGLLIFWLLNAMRIVPSQQRRVLVFVFFAYLVMETIWSIGTANWGTAIRHHIPAMGLLLLASFASRDCIVKQVRGVVVSGRKSR